MAHKQEIITALVDLKMTRSEAEVYTEMVLRGSATPVSGYGVAKAMGRDPANVTKLLAALERRGAVRVEQEKPRLFSPVPPEIFTKHLVQQARNRRQQALDLLAAVGTTVNEDGVYSLRNHAQVYEHCRQLLSDSRRLVLIEGDPDWLESMREDLASAAVQRQTTVLVRACRSCAIEGARIFVDPHGSTRIAMTPGSWLRLIVDGEQFVSAYCRRDAEQTVLQAFWSRSPFLAFQQHHDLGAMIVQTAWQDLRAGGAAVAVADARAAELAAVITHQIDWPARWQQLGLQPTLPEPAPTPGKSDNGQLTAGATTDQSVAANNNGLEFVFRNVPNKKSQTDAEGQKNGGAKKN